MIFIITAFWTIVISTTFRPICPPAFFRCLLSKYLRWSLKIFIIKGFRTIVFIFIVISTTFWLICPPAFFRCLLSKFLRWSLMIFIIKGFRTIFFIFIVISTLDISCLNFWDEALWFLSLRVFKLLSSLLLFPQCFTQYVLRPSSGVCCLNFWDEAWWFLSLRVFGLFIKKYTFMHSVFLKCGMYGK